MAEDCVPGFVFVHMGDIEADASVARATETLFREYAPTQEKIAHHNVKTAEAVADFGAADAFHFAESFDLMM